METKVILSNDKFWPWVDSIINGKEIECFEFVSRMIDVSRYFTSEVISDEHSDYFSMFHHLKKVMPKTYFREMEYCALAFSVIFERIFPPLAPHVDQLAYIEWLSYMNPENSRYRDHFVHMLKVAFVCDRIIAQNETLSRSIVSWQINAAHFKRWHKREGIYFDTSNMNNITNTAIFLAAIFHDFGYGYDFLRKYEEKLFKLNLVGCDSFDITKKRAEIIKRSLLGEFIFSNHEWARSKKSLSKKQEENTLLGFIRDCLPLAHSVASALVILDIAELLYRTQIIKPDLYVAFQIAAEACLLHDLTGDGKYLHLGDRSKKHNHFLDFNCYKEVPTGILLMLADELAIWNRPLIEFVPQGGNEQRIKIHHRWKNKQTYPKKIRMTFIEKRPKRLKILFERSGQAENFKTDLENIKCFTNKSTSISKVFNYKIEAT